MNENKSKELNFRRGGDLPSELFSNFLFLRVKNWSCPICIWTENWVFQSWQIFWRRRGSIIAFNSCPEWKWQIEIWRCLNHIPSFHRILNAEYWESERLGAGGKEREISCRYLVVKVLLEGRACNNFKTGAILLKPKRN